MKLKVWLQVQPSRIASLKLVLVQYLVRILINETAKSDERKAAAARIATTSFFCQNKFLLTVFAWSASKKKTNLKFHL